MYSDEQIHTLRWTWSLDVGMALSGRQWLHVTEVPSVN